MFNTNKLNSTGVAKRFVRLEPTNNMSKQHDL